MDWGFAAFQENTNLGQAVTAKTFLFLTKALAAIAYLVVLGFIAGGSGLTAGLKLFLILGFVLDMIPDIITFRLLDELPPTARNIEYIQYLVAMFAYTILGLTLFIARPSELFLGFATFTVIWLISFILQESTLFLTEIDHQQ